VIKRSILLWIIALVLTLALALFQRITGPTYPLEDQVQFRNEVIFYKLERSHGGTDDHPVKIKVKDPAVQGKLYWKRFKTNDEWTVAEMKWINGELSAVLPHQPPAGKLAYKVVLNSGSESITIPANGEVIIRFKGYVPAGILIPHVIFIFLAMLFSTRTGLEYFNKEPEYKKLLLTTYIFLVLGGLIFGPLTQLYAFGELWTGFPFGYDLTDNKTLIAFIGWTIALIALFRSKRPERWIIFASVLMFIIFLIPHSLLGSELDYNQTE